MRYRFLFCLPLFCPILLYGQKEVVLEKGTVTYVSSQNVYVKFASTENIQKGDTLYSGKSDPMIPGFVVKDKSSTSCVCSSWLPEKSKVGDEVFFKRLLDKKQEKELSKKEKEAAKTKPENGIKPPPVVITPAHDEKEEDAPRQKIRGRISAASYSNLNGADDTHRMRYTLNFQGTNLANSRFSTESYISFRHTLGEWDAVKANLNDALKVYSLSVKYDLNKLSSISLGRRINQRIASMGAVDGLQAEIGFGKVLFGAIAGSRPNYADYRLDLNLLQAGAYVSYIGKGNNEGLGTTLAFVEQHNHANVDRRFVYFQHSNALTKDLNLFASFEVDLYQNVDSVVTHQANLTNFLLSLRYRLSKKLNLNVSYDNRKNIIYYESYKSYIDQLIADESRQGLRLGLNYRITKMFSWGFNTSWRFQKSNINLSQNLNTYLNINRLPWINGMVSLSANILRTNYLDSKIYGIRISKELIRGKLNSEWSYRMVDYDYKNYENKIVQQIAGLDLSWNITRKLAFYLSFEGTFDPNNKPFNRLNTRIIQRF